MRSMSTGECAQVASGRSHWAQLSPWSASLKDAQGTCFGSGQLPAGDDENNCFPI